MLNITLRKAISLKKTAYEIWHNRIPNINCSKVFGYTVYVFIKSARSKLDEKPSKGIFVGYNYKGHKALGVE